MRVVNWDSLEWQRSKKNPDMLKCEVVLMPDEVLNVEAGWQVAGPLRVVLRHRESKKHTKATYFPLRDTDWDIDNPLEYPCGYCGADRLEACIGFNDACTYRVFSQGGKLV